MTKQGLQKKDSLKDTCYYWIFTNVGVNVKTVE